MDKGILSNFDDREVNFDPLLVKSAACSKGTEMSPALFGCAEIVFK